MSLATFNKDPNATLDYNIDWEEWLNPGDTISTSSWDGGGLSVVSDSTTSIKTTVVVSGGTAGSSYTLRNRITTVGGLADDRSLTIKVRES